MTYEGTVIGPDGKRYAPAAVPSSVVPDRIAQLVAGIPSAGQVPKWNPVTRRLEWGDDNAGSGSGVPDSYIWAGRTSDAPSSDPPQVIGSATEEAAHLLHNLDSAGGDLAIDAVDDTHLNVLTTGVYAVAPSVQWVVTAAGRSGPRHAYVYNPDDPIWSALTNSYPGAVTVGFPFTSHPLPLTWELTAGQHLELWVGNDDPAQNDGVQYATFAIHRLS